MTYGRIQGEGGDSAIEIVKISYMLETGFNISSVFSGHV
jgi:hypothetical protein